MVALLLAGLGVCRPFGALPPRLVAGATEVRGGERPDVTIYSPPVVTGPGELVTCVAHNVGMAAVDVTTRLRDSSGAELDEATTEVDVGEVETVVSTVDPASGSYCELAFDGNPAALRGYLWIGDGMGGNTRFVAAARGGDPFSEHAVPQAAIKLQQGFGRLIRSRSDRGCVVVLDSRIARKRYGQVFFDSLPPARRVIGPGREVFEELEAFFGRQGAR